MSKIDNNPLLLGISGMLAKMLVFRQFRGKLVVSHRPAKPRKLTPHQEEMKARFKDSIRYAKRAMQDVDPRAAYSAAITPNKFSAFHVAQTDALTPPIVHAIDTSRYRGAAGDPIIIHATDDFRVIAVYIVVTAADGNEIERGEATPIPRLADRWQYITRVVHAAVTQSRIIATPLTFRGM